MKKFKNTFYYLGLTGGCLALMYWVIILGEKLQIGKNIAQHNSNLSQWKAFINSMTDNLQHPLALLLVQIISIILVARLFGWICRKIGQPTVVGEMIAGIVLGPSLLGMYFPEFFTALFPTESLANLEFLSMIGLILYMFIVGMELDFKVLKNKAQDAIVISHSSIIIPFTMGVGLTYFIYDTFAPPGVGFLPFALFIGIAMSITAFPVLARIVQERGLQKKRLGTLVMTCAAADDITAWCLLAAVIAIAKAGTFISSLYTIGLAIIYVAFMLKAVRPFLARIGNLHNSKESMSKSIVGVFFLTLIISSYITEIIGIHALFGAFMTGAVMPNNHNFRNVFTEKIEDVATVLLLPLFFVFTGLRTQIGLLDDPKLWGIAGIIIVVAIAGKFLGSFLAAKFIGQNWKNSLMIGALMNTRGLVELIVLNIGYDLGVLSPEIFAILVIMSLVTTFMTGPILNLVDFYFKSKTSKIPEEITLINKFKVLISFGNPERGRSLLRLANSFERQTEGATMVTAMHLSPSNDLHQYNAEEYEQTSFAPIIEESKTLDQKITTLFKASSNIDADIVEMANNGNYDLLLIGVGQSIYEGSLLGNILGFSTRIINPSKLLDQVTGKENLFENTPFDERTLRILNKSKVSVAALIDKNFENTDKVLILVFSKTDTFLINYAQKLIKNSKSQITFLDVMGELKNNIDLKEKIRAIEEVAPNHVAISNEKIITKDFLENQNLMLVSMESWRKLVGTKSLWLTDIPSTLIIKEKH